MRSNVIFNGFEYASDIGVLERAFANIPLGYCLHMNTPKEHHLMVDAQTREYLSAHVLKWANYNVDWNTLHPLDEAVVERMRSCESVFLGMLARWDKRRTLPLERRQRLYLRHLRFWNDVLESRKIHLFLSKNIPHEGHDYILYCLCKERGIPTLMFHHINSIRDTITLIEDWEEPSREIVGVMDTIAKQYANCDIPLSEKFEDYFQTQCKHREEAGTTQNEDPWYLDSLNRGMKANYFPKLSLSKMFSERFWIEILSGFRRSRHELALFRFYNAHTVVPDLKRKFVYFALQYQPEMTTCPMGGVFNNQLLIAALLSATLPDDVCIYVKEHPAQSEECRSMSFYQDLLAMRRVYLVPREYNTFHLVRDCVAVATATGTVVLEALFAEKPVFMFGHRFYQYAPGVFPIRTKEDCQRAVDAIFKKGMKPEMRDVRLFLKALEKISFEGCIDLFYKPVTRLKEEENMQSVSEALRRKLRAYFPVPDLGHSRLH